MTHHKLGIYMAFGYSLQSSKRLFLHKVFLLVRSTASILSRKKIYKIKSISIKNNIYWVSFYYPGERLVYMKPVTIILKSGNLLENFNSIDASIIGFCTSNPSKDQLDKLKLHFYKNKKKSI